MVEANSTQPKATPESVFLTLREAIGLLPELESNNALELLVTLEVTVYHAEQLDLLADDEIKKIEAANFDNFTKLQLSLNWIEAKKLASSLINRAMREAIHAAIAIRRSNNSNIDSLIKSLEQILDSKSKKTRIGDFSRPTAT